MVRIFVSTGLLALASVSGCAADPHAERGNDESRYVTGSNIPRRSSVSSDHVTTTTTLDSGVGSPSPR